jgi:glycosyltransferase involved in cell wall biosynthesis
MNILFICDEYPPGPNGGIGSITRSLATELAQQGHAVFVAGLYSHEFGGKDYEELEGVKIWRFRYGFRLGKSKILYKVQRKLPSLVKRTLFARSSFREYCTAIETIITQYQIELIEHPDWISYGYDLGLSDVSLPKGNTPLILKLHGSRTYLGYLNNKSIHSAFRSIDASLLQRADDVVAVSQFTADLNKKLFQYPNKISVLYNGLKVPPYADPIGRATDRVVFAGTLVAQKGIYQLVRAWPLVLKQKPDAQLFILGKGDQEPLRKLISETHQKSIRFLGHQPFEGVQQQLSLATLAVLPSYNETFGLVAIEAMGTGCPTIFTKRSAGPEIINDGIDGLLVDPDNLNEIAEKIITLMEDATLRETIGRAGREKVLAAFDIRVCAAKHLAHYQHVIDAYLRA